MKVTADKMSEIVRMSFDKSLFKEGDDISARVEVDGISHMFYFDPKRLEEQREILSEVISMLPEKFKEGYTFLDLCRTKADELWTGEQLVCEELVVMSIGLELMTYCFSREIWKVLPGGVPYIIVK